MKSKLMGVRSGPASPRSKAKTKPTSAPKGIRSGFSSARSKNPAAMAPAVKAKSQAGAAKASPRIRPNSVGASRSSVVSKGMMGRARSAQAPGHTKTLLGKASPFRPASAPAAGPRGIRSGPGGRVSAAPAKRNPGARSITSGLQFTGSAGRKLPASLASRGASNTPRKMPSSRGTPGGGDERGTVTNIAKSPFKPAQGRVSVEPGGIAGFARGISQNFGRGVAEAGRQLGGYKGPSLPRSPLSNGTLGRDVNGNKGKSWINK